MTSNAETKTSLFRISKESDRDLAVKEFMKIKNPEQAKIKILEIYKERLSNPGMRDRKLEQEEIDMGIEYLSGVFDYAYGKHKVEKPRLTGEPYILHPAAVTYMIAKDKHIPLDELLIAGAASLCHDVLEDTDTLPSELRIAIGPEPTRDVIVLSKKMKVAEKRPAEFENELSQTGVYPFPDQTELQRWIAVRKGRKKSEYARIHRNYIQRYGSDRVKRIRLCDREHNMRTTPPRVPPPDIHWTEEESKKANNIRKKNSRELKHYFEMARGLGLTGRALAKSLRKAHQEKNRR